ncbi:MAG TPA: DNA cytosine methyltransferase [Nocardioides sp.]
MTNIQALRTGSLFSGYGGLDLAVAEVFGAEPVWFCEIEDAPSAILAHHWPDVPNLGDITAVDWDTVPPIDLLAGGFPCQDVSPAGKQAGLKPGTRSGLWSYFAYAISKLRPRYVVIENVRGLLSAEAHSEMEPCPWCVGDRQNQHLLRALGAVLGDLADLRYDARWCGIPASRVGAPHERWREFILAWDSQGSGRDAARPSIGRGEPTWPAGGPGFLVANAPQRAELRGVAQFPQWDLPYSDGQGTRRHAPAAVADSGRLEGLAEFHRESTENPADRSARGRHLDGRRDAAADPASERHGDTWAASVGGMEAAAVRSGAPLAADTARNGRHEGRAQPARQLGGPDASERGAVAADTDEHERGREQGEQQGRTPFARRGRGAAQWGKYYAAIQRWEVTIGRTAPAPTEISQGWVTAKARRFADRRPVGHRGSLHRFLRPEQRLSPRFVEWMMGLPAGWVTDAPGVPRNAQLKALGNGVVPQQAAAALRAMTTDWRSSPTN